MKTYLITIKARLTISDEGVADGAGVELEDVQEEDATAIIKDWIGDDFAAVLGDAEFLSIDVENAP